MQNQRYRAGQKLGRWRLRKQVRGHQHLWFVSAGPDKGVLKTPRYPDGRLLQRFYEEAQTTERLGGVPGVLPVIDREPGSRPRWFVTPEAVPLTNHLGVSPDFRAVVDAVQNVAATLADLAARPAPVAHRDVKPPNLFWYDGAPAVGDFGIAAWAGAPNRTVSGSKLGPANFLAPEMLSYNRSVKPWPADVYALAKTLFALAHGVPYPPPGQHDPDKWEYSLVPTAGNVTEGLARLVETATAYGPVQRPTMRQFADELADWLSQHPELPPHTRDTYYARTGFAAIYATLEEQRRMTRTVFTALRRAAATFGGPEGDDSVTPDVKPMRDHLPDGTWPTLALDRHDLAQPYEAPDDEPDPVEEPDGGLTLSVAVADGQVRLLLGGYVFNDEVTYFAEWQARQDLADGIDSSASTGWTLIWSSDAHGRIGYPSTASKLARLAADARAAEPAGGPTGAPGATLSRVW